MRRFSTILLYVTIAFLLLWQLPWCYNFFVVKPEKTPFTLYSFVIGDFAQMGHKLIWIFPYILGLFSIL